MSQISGHQPVHGAQGDIVREIAEEHAPDQHVTFNTADEYALRSPRIQAAGMREEIPPGVVVVVTKNGRAPTIGCVGNASW